ncbi:MAG: NlpC/P60 family protein [Acidimicrobiales bacterium]
MVLGAAIAVSVALSVATTSAWAAAPADGVAEPDGALFTSSGSYPPFGTLNAPVVGWTAAPSGGVWEVATDGIFTFGDAGFYGSTGNIRLNQPMVGMAATPDGHGYWLVASDGGIFTFGDAGFYGSAVGRGSAPATSVATSGDGYDVTLLDGSIWQFGPANPGTEIARLPIPSSYMATFIQEKEAQEAVAVALDQVGKPYAYGASGPGAFDCSGLTQYAYAAAGVALPRTAAEQFAVLPHVPIAQAQRGDLLFFYPGITHVGIYLGDGLMVDSANPGTVVRVEAFSWFGPVIGVGRPG